MAPEQIAGALSRTIEIGHFRARRRPLRDAHGPQPFGRATTVETLAESLEDEVRRWIRGGAAARRALDRRDDGARAGRAIQSARDVEFFSRSSTSTHHARLASHLSSSRHSAFGCSWRSSSGGGARSAARARRLAPNLPEPDIATRDCMVGAVRAGRADDRSASWDGQPVELYTSGSAASRRARWVFTGCAAVGITERRDGAAPQSSLDTSRI